LQGGYGTRGNAEKRKKDRERIQGPVGVRGKKEQQVGLETPKCRKAVWKDWAVSERKKKREKKGVEKWGAT